MMNPTVLLTALGMFDETSGRKLNQRVLAEFAERKRAFDWIHVGTTDLPIGKFVDVLRNNPQLSIPRTGHIGNWDDIIRGRAGMVDYNNVICGERRLGYPLIYNFTQTEDATLQEGDWIYLPGSIVEDGVRIQLPLFTWDGTQFIERTRDHALFIPFVLTPVGGQLVPLAKLHWDRMRRPGGYEFRLQSAVIAEHEALVREILHELVEEARTRPDPQAAFENILGRAVALDGRISRRAIQLEGTGYRIEGTYYESTRALVDAAMLPFLAANDPDAFFAEIAGLPGLMPLVSALLIEMFDAILNTHYVAGQIDRGRMTQPCNPHPHWGAVGMAGYPPKKRGYFAKNVNNTRKLYQSVIDRFPQIDPVFYLLLPASPFTLFPSGAYPGDLAMVEELIHEVKRATDPFAGNPPRIVQELEPVVRRWVDETRGSLSSYYRNRFASRRSVLNEVELPARSELIEPRGFSEMTFRQASMMVGALTENLC